MVHNNGDLVDAAEAQRILGLRRSWFYAHVAPVLTAHPVDWGLVRPKRHRAAPWAPYARTRRRHDQLRPGRPTGCSKVLYSRAEVEALRDLRAKMLSEADTRYLPWLLVVATWQASHRRAAANSAASQ